MTRETPTVDPASCPLCGGDNRCGRLKGDPTCWCEKATFDSSLLGRVPAAAVRRACICEPCVNGSSGAAKAARK